MNKNMFVVLGIIILIIVGYFVYTNNANKEKGTQGTEKSVLDGNKEPEKTDQPEDEWEVFENKDHKITLEYPSSWQFADLGGPKNVSEALNRENIGYFYTTDENKYGVVAGIKLLRFVIESDVKIQNENDWYDYIKIKVDDFLSNKELSENYTLIDLKISDPIDGKYVVEEIYTEDEYNGRDIYIYNGADFYQFVSLIQPEYNEIYSDVVGRIIKSFTIANE